MKMPPYQKLSHDILAVYFDNSHPVGTDGHGPILII